MPAPMSSTPPSQGLVLTIAGDSNAAALKPHCTVVASRLKAVQTAT